MHFALLERFLVGWSRNGGIVAENVSMYLYWVILGQYEFGYSKKLRPSLDVIPLTRFIP